jgi:hypothetical protein
MESIIELFSSIIRVRVSFIIIIYAKVLFNYQGFLETLKHSKKLVQIGIMIRISFNNSLSLGKILINLKQLKIGY